jgi:hypothetical protein
MPTPGAIKAARAILIQIHWQGIEPTNTRNLKWLEGRAHDVAEVIDREMQPPVMTDLSELLKQYGEAYAAIDDQEDTYGHAGDDLIARKANLESRITSLFASATEAGARIERDKILEWLGERLTIILDTRRDSSYGEGMIDECSHIIRDLERLPRPAIQERSEGTIND